MKKLIILSLIIYTIVICFVACSDSSSDSKKIADIKEYVPNDEFKEAYFTLAKNVSYDKAYDIEETIRIIHALEIAQAKSNGFIDFLEYMAKQDYSKVAPEVIEAKLYILPIFQEMHELQQEYKECDDIWNIASGVIQTTFKDGNFHVSRLFLDAATQNPLSPIEALDDVCANVAKEYIERKKIKSDLKKKINNIRSKYIDYLYAYTPIYNKYMNEWDKLCLEKDKTYMNLYSGNIIEACNSANNILMKYPENREAILLQALSLVNIVYGNIDGHITTPMLQGIEKITDSTVKMSSDLKDINAGAEILLDGNHIIEEAEPQNDLVEAEQLMKTADKLVDYYMNLYPDKTAPALLIKGLLNYRLGKMDVALSYFDQSAMEYVRQSAQLTDLLDSYANRSYLKKTHEGQYLLKLYKSTMGGFGMFSPNFWKADLYMKNGKTAKAQEEIYKHYFRRGNQTVYDCLLSDMQYCEEYLYSSFKQTLIEQSYLDLGVKPSSSWIILSSDDKVDVRITNRSDLTLENVRVFLCIHYTDMYKDEYDVIKVPLTKNRIEASATVDMGQVTLEYEDKKYSDITRIRAIALTDDKICWIDDVEYKSGEIISSHNKSLYGKNNILSYLQEGYLEDFSMTPESIKKMITNDIKISVNSSIVSAVTGNELIIELPRKLALLDPMFSLYQVQDNEYAQRPKENNLHGDLIRLKFDNISNKNTTLPLYIYSKFLNLKLDISYNGDSVSLESVSFI